MKKDSAIDYSVYILFRLSGFFFRLLPISLALRIGSLLGELVYLFDARHRSIAYSNIKQAFGSGLSSCALRRVTRGFYRSFGQNFIEMFFLPRFNRRYIEKYITIENRHYIDEAFSRGKGVIFLGVHEGSWEISNILCANLGFTFSLFIRNQRLFRLNELLNSYRRQKGCRIIQRDEGLRDLIAELKANHAIGMTLDQGGRSGMLVDFFGRDASMPTGAMRLALKYDTTILPAFYTRLKGPYVKVTLDKPFLVDRSGNEEEDLQRNLKRCLAIFEDHIRSAPHEYLWSYKIWKYSRERSILVLSDGKAGHIRQSEGMLKATVKALESRGMRVSTETRVVRFKSVLSKRLLLLSSLLSGKYACQGCLACLKYFLLPDSYSELSVIRPDIIISSGSGLAAVNLALSRENRATSVVVMRPSLINPSAFSLIAWPLHDAPPKRKNVVATEAALNPVDEAYLKRAGENISAKINVTKPLVLGLLLGGDSKGFRLDEGKVKDTIAGLKSCAGKLGAELLVSTSRRTSPAIEKLVKDELGSFPACRMLIIANENNDPDALGGILALSSVVVVSPESISMVSEAVSSGRYVVVFDPGRLNRRHRIFLEHLSSEGYIYLTDAQRTGSLIEGLLEKRPAAKALGDSERVSEAIARLI